MSTSRLPSRFKTFIFEGKLSLSLLHKFGLFLWARKEVRAVRHFSNVLENRDSNKYQSKKGKKIKKISLVFRPSVII